MPLTYVKAVFCYEYGKISRMWSLFQPSNQQKQKR